MSSCTERVELSMKRRHRTGRRRLAIESLESRRLLATYYIDPVQGDDANTGLSREQSFRTPRRLVSQYFNRLPPGHISLAPGDVVNFAPGTHDFIYRYGDPPGDSWQSLFFRNIHGTAEAPITIRGEPGARLRSFTDDPVEVSAVTILQSSHLVVEGFDVSSFGSAVTVSDSAHVTVRGNYIHDVDGDATNNLAGVFVTASHDVTIRNNLLVDNFDRSRVGNQNNRHVVIFGSTEVSVQGNTMIYTEHGAGAGVEYKHLGSLQPEEHVGFEVSGNVIRGAARSGIGTAAPQSHIHGNLLIDSGAIRVADLGGKNRLADELIEYNTIFNETDQIAAGALDILPFEYAGFPLGIIAFENNLVSDRRDYGHVDKSTVTLNRYGPDDQYRRLIDDKLFRADGNFYETQDPARFDVFGAATGERGFVADWDQWQARGFDIHGGQGDARLTAAWTSDRDAGWSAGGEPRLLLLADPRDVWERGPAAAGETTVWLSRVGDDIESELEVRLSLSDETRLQAPALVSFAPGERSRKFAVTGRPSAGDGESVAVRIRAVSEGFSSADTWVRVPGESVASPRRGVFQLPGDPGSWVRTRSVVGERGAEYDNEFGVALVDDAQGRVAGLSPSDDGWTAALLARGASKVLLPSGVTAGDRSSAVLEADRFVVFYLVQNATTGRWLLENPDNDSLRKPLVFTTIPESNPMGFDHTISVQAGDSIAIAWEDIEGGGDQNFTDLVVEVTIDPVPSGICYPIAYDRYLEHHPRDGALELDLHTAPVDEKGAVVSILDGPSRGSLRSTDDPGRQVYHPEPFHYGVVEFAFQTRLGAVEDRATVAIDLSKRWNNTSDRYDVNDDRKVTALDALLVINAIARHGTFVTERYPQGSEKFEWMVDVNDDGRVTALDALLIINRMALGASIP